MNLEDHLHAVKYFITIKNLVLFNRIDYLFPSHFVTFIAR